MRVLQVEADGAAKRLDGLVELLWDAVDSGASLSYLPPLTAEEATRFWLRVIGGIADGERVLVVAEDNDGVAGAVQLGLIQTPNQPHRAEVAELMVHRRARRKGLGRVLMERIEDEARRVERTLITLDTRTGDFAEPLCEALGYTKAGVIPGFAMNADGGLSDTSFFWKRVEPGQ